MVTVAQMSAPVLPRLRRDLRWSAGPVGEGGAPSFTLTDPLRHRFFLIGWREHALLRHWNLGDPARIVEEASVELGQPYEPAALGELADFLVRNELVEARDEQATARLAAHAVAGHTGWARWLLHSYLYLRIPLIYPDRFLEAALPVVAPFYTRRFLGLMVGIATLTIFLITRQWDVFTSTFVSYLSIDGVLPFTIALCAAKLVHEFAHAFTAKRYGCRVPAMGVALVVMWPVLFTDTSATWTLRRRSQRLAVGAAGMVAEMVMGTIAGLLWCLASDGPLRSALFLVATTTWITSLLVNLNPFLRFDGYYLLSDFVGVPNLQERAFALGRWAMRKALLGIDTPLSERPTPKATALLIGYAYATWLYRAVLFLGIALTVYHLFFKLLGIMLMAVEVVWFLLRPVWTEAKVWWRCRQVITRKRNAAITAGIGVTILLAVIPWPSRLWAPAVLVALEQERVFAPAGARVKRILVTQGQAVSVGDSLVELESPETTQALIKANIRIAELRWKIHHVGQMAAAARQLKVFEEQLSAAQGEADGLRVEEERMRIRAPQTGIVVALADGLEPGRWVAHGELLAHIANAGRGSIEAFATEAELADLARGQTATFYFDSLSHDPIQAKISRIDSNSLPVLTWPMLASDNGGSIETTKSSQSKLVPLRAWYRLVLDPVTQPVPVDQQHRGHVALPGQSHSILVWALRGTYVTLIRESGF